MCYKNINGFVMEIEINKPLDTHEKIVGISWSTWSIAATTFSGVIIMMSGELADPIFHTTLDIFVKGLQRDSCDGL